MVRFIKGDELTYKDIKKIKYILKERSYYDYQDFDIILNYDKYINKKHLKDGFVFLGDDWFLSFRVSGENVYLDEFFALPGSFQERIGDIIQLIKYMLNTYKGYTAIANLRHVTTYKLYKNLLNRGKISSVDDVLNINTGDDNLDILINKEIYLGNQNIIDEYSQYISHHVVFIIGENNDISPETIEKTRYYKYIKRNQGGYVC